MTTTTIYPVLPAPAPEPSFDAPPPGRLLGEVISWACPGVAVPHAALLEALRAAGLAESAARALAPRHAFARACRRLSERRVIRRVAEDARSVRFQFTAESRAGDSYEYTLETMLELDKRTGLVSCGLPGLASLAQAELDRAVGVRTGSDVTRVVQRLFEREADLFPVRPQGGCYFVPERHAAFVGRVADFLSLVGGRTLRFPVPAGTPEGDRSVRDSVAAGLSALISEHRRAVGELGADPSPAALGRAAARVRAARFKVEAYAEYLAGERGRLERELESAARELRARVESLAAAPA